MRQERPARARQGQAGEPEELGAAPLGGAGRSAAPPSEEGDVRAPRASQTVGGMGNFITPEKTQISCP